MVVLVFFYLGVSVLVCVLGSLDVVLALACGLGSLDDVLVFVFVFVFVCCFLVVVLA